MFRNLAKIFTLLFMVVAGALALHVYEDRFSATFQIRKLEDEKHQLQQVVQRLSTEKRVAEVLVTDQATVNGIQHTTLLFVEYARDGSPLTPKSFTIEGNVAHFDALVIKFDHDLVQKDDPLRGHSIALFSKVFGDYQKPADGFPIDSPGQIPDIYRGSDPRVPDFEKDLWANFWKLATDKSYAASKGVRIANGQGNWGPLSPDILYTLTLESDGGLNMTTEPVKGIYKEALKRRAVG